MSKDYWLGVVEELDIFFSLRLNDKNKNDMAEYLDRCFDEAVIGAELIPKRDAYDYVCDNPPDRYP